LIKRLRDGTYPELAKFILEKTNFINEQKPNNFDEYSWLYRIYCIINNLKDFPKCKNPKCQNKIDKPSGFLGEKKGFRPYCSIKCGASAPDVIKHREETCLHDVGVKNKSKLISTKRKVLETRLKNGNTFKQQVEKARITRYLTNNGKWHADDFGNKVKITKINNGHSANWTNIEKRKETLKNNYGVDNVFKIPSIRNASRIAIFKKSYIDHILNCEFDEPLFTFEEYLNRSNDNEIFKFKCKKCNTIFESSHHDGKHKRCPHCFPKIEGISVEEIDLKNFV
jgi:hypothetical protein